MLLYTGECALQDHTPTLIKVEPKSVAIDTLLWLKCISVVTLVSMLAMKYPLGSLG